MSLTSEDFRGDGHGRNGYVTARIDRSEGSSNRRDALRRMIEERVREARERLAGWGIIPPIAS